MNVEFVEQLGAHGFAGSTFERHVVWNDDRGAAVHFEQRLDVLGEIDLPVAPGRRWPGAIPVELDW